MLKKIVLLIFLSGVAQNNVRSGELSRQSMPFFNSRLWTDVSNPGELALGMGLGSAVVASGFMLGNALKDNNRLRNKSHKCLIPAGVLGALAVGHACGDVASVVTMAAVFVGCVWMGKKD